LEIELLFLPKGERKENIQGDWDSTVLLKKSDNYVITSFPLCTDAVNKDIRE